MWEIFWQQPQHSLSSQTMELPDHCEQVLEVSNSFPGERDACKRSPGIMIPRVKLSLMWRRMKVWSTFRTFARPDLLFIMLRVRHPGSHLSGTLLMTFDFARVFVSKLAPSLNPDFELFYNINLLASFFSHFRYLGIFFLLSWIFALYWMLVFYSYAAYTLMYSFSRYFWSTYYVLVIVLSSRNTQVRKSQDGLGDPVAHWQCQAIK